MENKKIFMSYKMDLLTEAEILKEKEWLSQYVKSILGKNVEIIDSYIESDSVFDHIIYKADPRATKYNALTYLGGSLVILSIADYLYVSESASNCRGCTIEQKAAQVYGIPILKNLSKRIEMDSYVIDVYENRLQVGIRDDLLTLELFDKPIEHDEFIDFYDLAISAIQKYNEEQGLKWNEFPRRS